MTVSQYDFDNAAGPFSPNQTDGGVTTNDFAIVGSGASFDGTYLNVPVGTSLDAGALGIALPTDTDPALTQTRESITLEYIGILPASETPLVSLYRYNQARFALFSHWDAGRMRMQLERDGTTVQLSVYTVGIRN
ncbi:hypothetical protein [Parasphingorhabdus sp.]|jgi:hypothetical protein|uniref:hypothetical protein n=1 Tax=Parasphingorhabdus sp. TaxID=2709688 RepID=UPI003D2AF5AB